MTRRSGLHHPYLEGVGPRVFAHRGLITAKGAAVGVAENSLASLSAAVDAGARYVESDCHLTRDGQLVLFHDDDLSHVTGDPRLVAEVTRAELAELMSDLGGLLTLEEALERWPHTRFNLDVKAEQAAEPLGRLVAPHAERVLVASFSDRFRKAALRAAADSGRGSRLPATAPGRAGIVKLLAALTLRSGAAARRALDGVDALQVPETYGPVRVLSPRLIAAAHGAGVEVHVWTVNDPVRMRQLVEAGVDGIITDRADIALEVLDKSD